MKKAIPFLTFEEIAFSFGFFRGGVLDNYQPGPFAPLTDECARRCIEGGSDYERGLALLRYHFEPADGDNSALLRINSFVLLLRQEAAKPTRTWKSFVRDYDQFFPVMHAIAWSPAVSGEAFPRESFMETARKAPLPTSWQPPGRSRVC